MKRFIVRQFFTIQLPSGFMSDMSDLRHDPINDQWIAIADNRRERPMEFVPMEQMRQQIICPFCRGNEDETPAALAAYRADGSMLGENADPADWTVRVIPNKYPSFSTQRPIEPPRNSAPVAADLSEPCPTALSGIQELIIPSARHITTLSELEDNELRCAFRVGQDRIELAASLPSIKHAMWFMNCRHDAGASLGHIHMQLIGSPVVGGLLTGRVQRNLDHVAENGCTLIESLMNQESKQGDRVVQMTENFCIFCPFASRFAYQVFIVPRDPQVDFLSCTAELRDELAFHCRILVSRLETLLDNPGYNMLLHIEPFDLNRQVDSGRSSTKNWYLEIFPRITRPAGFEWGADIWVNPVAPEIAARQLNAAYA